MQQKVTARKNAARVALCVALSLLVHGSVGWALLVSLRSGVGRGLGRESAQVGGSVRVLQVIRPEQEPEEKRPKPFAKTSPDVEESVPWETDFVGKHSSVADGAKDAPKRRSDAPVPTQDGAEDLEEVVTFDQKRQDGELEYDGKEMTQQESPAVGGPPPPLPTEPAEHPPAEETHETEVPAEAGAASILPLPPTAEGDLLLQQAQLTPQGAVQIPVHVQPVAEPVSVMHDLPPGMAGAVYDPSLADHMQPRTAGFRTRERRTRSTGRFGVGSKPSLNVAATPLGRYEEEIYRRVAYFWYIACDEHRGDIVPGSVVISLRINTRGQLVNMDLVRRRGASVSQQSFTFAAIRRASLPPMPPAVQQEIVGDLLELIFQFNFD